MALVTTATLNFDLNLASSDLVTGEAVGGTAFVYINSVETGNDTLELGKNDSLLTTSRIFDSNEDNHLQFNSNTDTVQSDRVADGSFVGNDTITFTDVDGRAGLRYLGERDGYFVYADKTVYNNVKTLGLKEREGTVNNDTINGSGAADGFFYDTALGLNLGNDTITNFAASDRLVTTTLIFDSNDDGKINFSGNKAVDLPGDVGSESGSGNEFGGIVSLTDTDGDVITALYLVDIDVVNGVTYYQYGTQPVDL